MPNESSSSDKIVEDPDRPVQGESAEIEHFYQRNTSSETNDINQVNGRDHTNEPQNPLNLSLPPLNTRPSGNNSAASRSRSLLFDSIRSRINHLAGLNTSSDTPASSSGSSNSSNSGNGITNNTNNDNNNTNGVTSHDAINESSAIDDSGSTQINRRRRRTFSQDSATSNNNVKRRSIIAPSIRHRFSQVRSLFNGESNSSSPPSSSSSTPASSTSSLQSPVPETQSESPLSRPPSTSSREPSARSSLARFLDRPANSSLNPRSRFFPTTSSLLDQRPSDSSSPSNHTGSIRLPFPIGLISRSQDQTDSTGTPPQPSQPSSLLGSISQNSSSNAEANPTDPSRPRQPATIEEQATILAQLLAIAATATAYSLLAGDQNNFRDGVTRSMSDLLTNFTSPTVTRESMAQPGSGSSDSQGSTTAQGEANSTSGNASQTTQPNDSAESTGSTEASRRDSSLQSFIRELQDGALTTQIADSLRGATAPRPADENAGNNRSLNYVRMFQLASGNPRVENGVNMIPVLIVGIRSANFETEAGYLGSEGNTSNASGTENSSGEQQTSTTSSTTATETTANAEPASNTEGTTTENNATNGENMPRQAWVVYVLGGTYPENHPVLQRPSILSNNPTYEDLLELEILMGPVKSPVATLEEVTKGGGLFYVGKEVEAESADSDTNMGSTQSSARSSSDDLTKELANEIRVAAALKHAAATIQGTRCLICFSDFEHGEECRLLKKCQHSFHRVCIDKWLTTGRNNCPSCRSEGVKKLDDKKDTIESTTTTTTTLPNSFRDASL